MYFTSLVNSKPVTGVSASTQNYLPHFIYERKNYAVGVYFDTNTDIINPRLNTKNNMMCQIFGKDMRNYWSTIVL